MRATDIDTGSGLRYTILPDRGMDISLASYKGINLVYLTSNGETHPLYYKPEGAGWLRTFGGGLLTTCGLTHLGPPCEDDGDHLGLHGRYSTIPAKQFADHSGWKDDEFQCRVTGIMEEGALFDNKLRLEREITSVLGHNSISIRDTITNFGNHPSPYTILYHMNFGFPFLSGDSELIIDPEETWPRDTDAVQGMNECKTMSEPQSSFKEQVFFHKMKHPGNANASLINRKMKIGVSITFNTSQLPCLTQWKMMGYGEYVMGIEPGNVWSQSRKELRDTGKLPFLQAGERTSNQIDICVSDIS
jgi:hypothetical protein